MPSKVGLRRALDAPSGGGKPPRSTFGQTRGPPVGPSATSVTHRHEQPRPVTQHVLPQHDPRARVGDHPRLDRQHIVENARGDR